MRESTRVLMKKHGWRIDRAIHNYLYFVYYNHYVMMVYFIFKFLSTYFSWVKPFRYILRTAFSRYHAKILSYGDARKIFELNEEVLAVSGKNRQIIPYKYAYKLMLEDPEFIAVMDCPCKKTLHAQDWTINSCISVGRKTSQFWIDRCGEKYHARKISQQEALDLIKKFRKKGYLTQAFFKVATGGNIGIICNCHIDSCVSLQATQFAKRFDMDLSMAANSGYSVAYDETLCRECGTCVEICQFRAIQIHEGHRAYYRDVCMGCDLCTEHCPEKALNLYRDTRKTVPLDLDIVKKEYATV